MTKIKSIGILILLLIILLLVVMNIKSNNNIANLNQLDKIYKQKEYTQSLAKNIFFIYKNKNECKANITQILKQLKLYMDKEDKNLDRFYENVVLFRDNIKVRTAYSDLILTKLVNKIYQLNFNLVIKFNKKIKEKQISNKATLQQYINIQYGIFILLILLLVYLLIYTFRANSSFDKLIAKIDKSINDIDSIESNIENIINIDTTPSKSAIKKEDKIIESLDELLNTQIKLVQLKQDLENLALRDH
jgi:energy-coupling factor transporter transmembrane protein EcfT